MDEVGEKTFIILSNGLISSLDTVLAQEMIKFNRLLNRMYRTLEDLKKAIKGLVVMSLDLDKMYTSFLNNSVPDLWETVGFASLKPLASWVKDLIGRVAFFRKWLIEGQPAVFDFPVFFFPQGFMTGTLQTHARKYKVAVDTLSYSFFVYEKEADEISEGAEDGVICSGMFMEGARWDKTTKKIELSYPGEIYTPVPPVHFLPTENYSQDPKDYACPVYKTSTRQGMLSTTGISTNFVIGVFLPTSVIPDSWVSSGVALILNLDD